MFKEKGEVIFLAVLVIVISAALSGFGTYFLFGQKPTKDSGQENQEILLDENSNQPAPAVEENKTSPSPESEEVGDVKVQTENMGVDTQKAAKALGEFYFFLESGEYDKAAKLVDWQYVDNDLLENAFGITSGLADRAGVLEEICSQGEVKTKIRILSAKEPVSGEDIFFFRVNYLEENDQVYVSSSHVAGQFINETEFIIEVIKRGADFLVRTLPGAFVLE
jgi:hypothetical protein